MNSKVDLSKLRIEHLLKTEFESKNLIWPLNIDEAHIVGRITDKALCIIDKQGQVYALNGIARQFGFKNINPLWGKDHKKRYKDLTDLINTGLELLGEDKTE